MSGDRGRTIKSAAVGIMAGLAVLAAATGFLLIPAVEGRAELQGIWNAICSAAGLIRPSPSDAVVQPASRGTQAVVTQQIMRPASAASIGNGATLALRCMMCHGARRLSEAEAPNLAGQHASMVYKQLLDDKSGARTNAVMTPIAAGLTEAQVRDLAAYAYLPRLPANHAGTGPVPETVASGAPMRNTAPCGACHGGRDSKAGSAWLDGQPEASLLTQLRAFGSGARHNDISGQMRNIARQMTPAEMTWAARYYAGRP